jgi:hypothetical protein
MHLVDGVSKKEVARRLSIIVKTVRRALRYELAPVNCASPPPRHQLAEHRDDVLADRSPLIRPQSVSVECSS